MNPVDRATLIDFALGRLEDAEAAALARRAEVDSEFAQTLDALRQELTTLDRVRIDALRAAPRRAPLVIADVQNRQNAEVGRSLDRFKEADFNEDAENTASVLPSDAATPDVRNASDGENGDDVRFSASASNVVKIRRVGPAYPFYADEPETSPEETEPSQTLVDENSKVESFVTIEQNGENAQLGEARQETQDEQLGEKSQTARPFKRFDFIPKFIAAASPRPTSPFVAKKARLLGDAEPFFSPVDEIASAETLFETSRLTDFEAQENVEVFNVDDAPRNEETLEIQNPDSPNDAENPTQTTLISGEEIVCRVDYRENVEVFNVDDAPRNEETLEIQNPDSPNNAENPTQTTLISGEEIVCRVDNQENAEVFNASNLAARRLVELLGREPTATEREEYYWEEIDENENAKISAEFRRPSLLQISARWATAPVVAVGRATLSLCGSSSRAILGADAFAATKPRRRRQPGQASDTMISTVAGILIATFVVFPLMRLAVREMFATIAKSAVRKIGENVAISENAPQSDLLPFISEQLVFPRYETATPQGVGVETLLETGTRSETPLSSGDAPPLPVDPASTQPTLETVPDGAPLPDELSPTPF